jgi:hypothetical protein
MNSAISLAAHCGEQHHPRKNAVLALMGLGQFSLDYSRAANSQMGLARFSLDYSRVVNSQRELNVTSPDC